jgi:hypothetical protein
MHSHYRRIVSRLDGVTRTAAGWEPLAHVDHPAHGVTGGVVVLAVRYETVPGSDTPRAIGRLMYRCSDGYTGEVFDALLGSPSAKGST